MMEEKFDTEFKRKVKGINPEIPDVVRMRISDTLSALPEKRIFWKSGYLSAVAALFLVCFVGIRYIYPMQLAKNSALESAKDSTMTAADTLKNENDQGRTSYKMEAGIAEDKTADNNTDENKTIENNTGNSTNEMLKAAQGAKAFGASGALTGTAPATISGEGNTDLVLTGTNGKTSTDQGIQLILKTAIYDGKEIRIEFDKISTRAKVFTTSTEQENDTTSNVKPDSVLKSVQANVVKNYDVRIVVDNIPLKCSINVLETSQGENQYSGTMIIVPDSSLPEKFNMILSFDKIEEITGQWLLTTQVSK